MPFTQPMATFWLLPDAIGPEVVVLFFVTLFLLMALLAIMWLVYFRR